MQTIFFDRERHSDSPFVEKVWTSHSEHGGWFISAAECRWEIVIAKFSGRATMYVRGPESRASSAYCPPEGEWLGIRFRPHTYLIGLPPRSIVDTALAMPESKSGHSQIFGSSFEIPTFDNAEVFVAKLARLGYLFSDTQISRHLAGEVEQKSIRSVQRRFSNVLGLTSNQVFQIERARYAATLLSEGWTILDTVAAAGYFDQAHFTRWARLLIGETPGKIADTICHGRLSFLYKTALLPFD